MQKIFLDEVYKFYEKYKNPNNKNLVINQGFSNRDSDIQGPSTIPYRKLANLK